MDFKVFSRSTLAQFCVLVSFTLFLVNSVESSKKCSKTLRRIPVHKKFDLKRFSGTWYSISRTTLAWGKGTYDSFTIEVAENNDGSYQFSYTGELGDKCLPVQSGSVEEQESRPGQYILRLSNYKGDQPTMIVSFTDYRRMALLYFCFKYRSGTVKQCHKTGMQIEILSRDLEPSEGNVTSYITRAGKRLCIKPKMLKSTNPGLCKIPEILAAAKQRELDLEKADSKSSKEDVCAVNNIPTQSGFNAASLSGLWYEIARTRFTFNKMESVVNYHRYDELTNQIYSYYTGTLPSQTTDDGDVVCMTAIQGMSKTVDGAPYDSDRLGRIGWDDSTYPWSPTKVLYADDQYILFYACYSGESNDICPHEYMEVTLSARSRDITLEKKEEIYSLLPAICVNPADMTDTQFPVNCSGWVTVQPEVVHPEDCKVDDIQVYDDYVSNLMTGTWYLYSSITFNNMTSLNGVVMKKQLAMSEGIETRTLAFDDEDTCSEYFSRSRDMCYDSADHIITLPGGDGKFVFSKVVYLDEDLLVEYVCSARTVEGTCNRTGIQFNVYTKNDTSDEDFVLPVETQDTVSQLAKTVCLDPNDLELQTEWCNVSDFAEEDMTTDYVDCDLDQIQIFGDMGDYVQEEIYGVWYEVAKSSNKSWESLNNIVAYFTSPNNETLQIYYTGFNESESERESPTCADVSRGSLLTRCHSDIIGDFLYRFEETGADTSYVPFKILYTDGTNMLITYMCTEMLQSGQCSAAGTEVSIWSRTETLDEDSLLYADEMVLWTCPEPIMFHLQGSSACRQNLEDYIEDNVIDHDQSNEDDEDGETSEESDIDSDENDENNDQQRDQGQNKYELDDLERELLMDDHEFYYGQ